MQRSMDKVNRLHVVTYSNVGTSTSSGRYIVQRIVTVLIFLLILSDLFVTLNLKFQMKMKPREKKNKIKNKKLKQRAKTICSYVHHYLIN